MPSSSTLKRVSMLSDCTKSEEVRPQERSSSARRPSSSSLMQIMPPLPAALMTRSEEHTSELQSLMRISYAVFCLKKKNRKETNKTQTLGTYTKQHSHAYKDRKKR